MRLYHVNVPFFFIFLTTWKLLENRILLHNNAVVPVGKAVVNCGLVTNRIFILLKVFCCFSFISLHICGDLGLEKQPEKWQIKGRDLKP